MPLVLVLGGVRSGKSVVAERIAAGSGAPVRYLATGSATDPEMAERIERHRTRRPAGWLTVECDEPELVQPEPGETLLVDGIAPWLARRMGEEGLWTGAEVAPLGPDGLLAQGRVLDRVRAFARAAADRPAFTVVVAEESGLGVVPTGASTRRYLDLAGEATQTLAEHAARVVLVVAGQPIDLRHTPRPADLPLRSDPPLDHGQPSGADGLLPTGQHRPRSPWPNPSEAGNEPATAAVERPQPEPGSSAPCPEPVALGIGPPSSGRSAPGGPALAPAATPASADIERLRVHGDAMVRSGQLDFAVSVVPGGPPDWLREAMAAALDRAGSYPDERPAVEALAARHGRRPDEVLATNGSAEAFWLLAGVLRPRRAAVVHPSFTEPEAALRAAGHRVERVFREPSEFTLDPSLVPAEADLVVLGNPNNPTGTLDPAEVVAGLARPGRLLVVDEAFMELVPDEAESLAAGREIPGLVVVRSLTKLWSLAGIRAGYLLGPPELIQAARASRQPWSVSGPACAVLTAWARRTATSGGAEAAVIGGWVAAAREELATALAALPGVRLWPSAANFLLLRVPDGAAVCAGLGERGIAVRRADTFPGLTADHLRVAVRRPEENRRLVEALRDVLGIPVAAARR
jgi:histidinol-phosphate/aromatic aminotransferase/cobyric acid decarboxylase-like protein/adenosyl cobinamide kinase/adenosyl cobinamide phosphate guanylyltransferase